MKRESFREDLLSAEKISPELRERYRQEVRNMLERKMTRREKIAWILIMFLCCDLAVIFGWAALFAAESATMRVWFGLGVVFPLVFIAFGVTMLRRGKLHRVRDEETSTRISFAFVLIMMTFALVWGGMIKDRVVGISLVLGTLVFYITFGVMPMILNRVNRAEWKLREDLLRIELELAELGEKLARKEKE